DDLGQQAVVPGVDDRPGRQRVYQATHVVDSWNAHLDPVEPGRHHDGGQVFRRDVEARAVGEDVGEQLAPVEGATQAGVVVDERRSGYGGVVRGDRGKASGADLVSAHREPDGRVLGRRTDVGEHVLGPDLVDGDRDH